MVDKKDQKDPIPKIFCKFQIMIKIDRATLYQNEILKNIKIPLSSADIIFFH